MRRQGNNHTRRRSAQAAWAKEKTVVAPVLVVDDEPVVRQAVVDILIGAGFPVVEAGDGAVAIELLRGGLRPSLILLDLSMPRMDGRAFRAEQTKDRALREIATVVLTGSRVDPDALGRELGGVRVMAKPVDDEQLLSLAGHYCARAA
jgi:CheY-like chemotaxis protein